MLFAIILIAAGSPAHADLSDVYRELQMKTSRAIYCARDLDEKILSPVSFRDIKVANYCEVQDHFYGNFLYNFHRLCSTYTFLYQAVARRTEAVFVRECGRVKNSSSQKVFVEAIGTECRKACADEVKNNFKNEARIHIECKAICALDERTLASFVLDVAAADR